MPSHLTVSPSRSLRRAAVARRLHRETPHRPALFVLVVAVLLTVGLPVHADPQSVKPGPLVVVGGGGTPPEVIRRAIALAGGADAEIVIIALASRRENAAEGSAKMFREAGARRVSPLQFTEKSLAADKERIAKAAMIWFPGGSQNRLMDRLKEHDLVDLIRARHVLGAVIGGTSAGAAVMSQVMITGGAPLDRIERGATPSGEGLGLWPGVIVDQHFHRRQRFNRLLSLVSDQPALVGIGIDERTAVIVDGEQCEVVGESNVAVVDARNARLTPGDKGSLLDIRGVRLDIVPAGSSFTLSRHRMPTDPSNPTPSEPKSGAGGTGGTPGGTKPSDGEPAPSPSPPPRTRPESSRS